MLDRGVTPNVASASLFEFSEMVTEDAKLLGIASGCGTDSIAERFVMQAIRTAVDHELRTSPLDLEGNPFDPDRNPYEPIGWDAPATD